MSTEHIPFLTFRQVARRLQIGRRTVADWASKGRLPVVWLGPRSPRVLETDLREFIKRNRKGVR
ncbi:MAG: helix-turn-helix domain-containing protein [Planctomycetota bacterium]